MLMEVVKNKIVEENHLKKLNNLLAHNQMLQKESDDLVKRLLEKSSQIEEKKIIK